MSRLVKIRSKTDRLIRALSRWPCVTGARKDGTVLLEMHVCDIYSLLALSRWPTTGLHVSGSVFDDRSVS